MSKTEIEYEILAKEYISNLLPQTQKLAVNAIEDCLALGRSWRWINTALNKKGYSNWNRWHFGLLFSNNFNASVMETMNREDEAEFNDLGEFFEILEEEKEYTFPQTLTNSSSNAAHTEIDDDAKRKREIIETYRGYWSGLGIGKKTGEQNE